MGAELKVPRIRPTYSEEIAERICEALKQGQGLKTLCREEGMPDAHTVRDWVADNYEGFAPRYTRARDIGLDQVAEDVLDIADNSELEADDRRVRLDARKWYLSKIAPKRYGDRTEHVVDVTHRYVVVGETEALTDETWIEGTVER